MNFTKEQINQWIIDGNIFRSNNQNQSEHEIGKLFPNNIITCLDYCVEHYTIDDEINFYADYHSLIEKLITKVNSAYLIHKNLNFNTLITNTQIASLLHDIDKFTINNEIINENVSLVGQLNNVGELNNIQIYTFDNFSSKNFHTLLYGNLKTNSWLSTYVYDPFNRLV